MFSIWIAKLFKLYIIELLRKQIVKKKKKKECGSIDLHCSEDSGSPIYVGFIFQASFFPLFCVCCIYLGDIIAQHWFLLSPSLCIILYIGASIDNLYTICSHHLRSPSRFMIQMAMLFNCTPRAAFKAFIFWFHVYSFSSHCVLINIYNLLIPCLKKPAKLIWYFLVWR